MKMTKREHKGGDLLSGPYPAGVHRIMPVVLLSVDAVAQHMKAAFFNDKLVAKNTNYSCHKTINDDVYRNFVVYYLMQLAACRPTSSDHHVVWGIIFRLAKRYAFGLQVVKNMVLSVVLFWIALNVIL
jgi:hypothetical protein